MMFRIQETLANRGPVSQEEPSPSDQKLLVGETAICKWEDSHTEYGRDFCQLYPAVYGGEKAWLERRVWDPAYGYSASGESERILSFETGVQLLLEKGAYEHLFADVLPHLSVAGSPATAHFPH